MTGELPDDAMSIMVGDCEKRKRKKKHLKDAVVENDHDKAGDVEGAQGGPDDKIRVKESTWQRF